MNRAAHGRPRNGRRVIADNAEQMARDVRRTVTAVEAIVDDVKGFYKVVVSPLVEWLKSKQAGPPAKVQVLVSTEGVR